MTEYVLRLIVLLPIVCGLIIGGLYLTKRLQERTGMRGGVRLLSVVEVMSLTPTTRIAVIAFEGRRLLVAVGKNGVTPLPLGVAPSEAAE